MANTSSAKKAVRSSSKKKLVNDRVRENIKTARKALDKAIAGGTKTAKLQTEVSNMYKAIDKAAKKSVGVISQNKAARMKSAVAKKVAQN